MADERDFSAGGREFKLNKIDPFKQFHVVRRLGPLLGDIIPAAKKITALVGQRGDGSNLSEEEKFDQIATLAKPLMNGFAELSDEDANHVLLTLLEAVEVKHTAGSWARIARDGNMMIQYLELPVLLQCAGRAFGYNLRSFFDLAHQTSHGGK